MTVLAAGERADSGACPACRRRSRLLCAVRVQLDYCARDRGRLIDALALDDGELLAAFGGRRRAELARRLELPEEPAPRAAGQVPALCRHDRRYPRGLLGASSPRMLFLDGSPERLQRLAAAPVVTMLGSHAPSDYGVEVARTLARELAACGVTIAATLADGVPSAAHEGALGAPGAAIAALAGGLDVRLPAARAALLARVVQAGCAVAELPPGCEGRTFGTVAAERLVAELAHVALVVEAREGDRALFGATVARSRGRTVAAVPGRVSSPLSRGAHELLRSGAALVRDASDVLELLGRDDAHGVRPRGLAGGGPSGLRAELACLLEQVAAGHDTPERLRRAGADAQELLLGLSELELMGLIGRGHGGRYVVCGAAARPADPPSHGPPAGPEDGSRHAPRA